MAFPEQEKVRIRSSEAGRMESFALLQLIQDASELCHIVLWVPRIASALGLRRC